MTSDTGMTQLQMMFPARVLTVPATMWNGTMAMNTQPHSVVSLRLTALNAAEPQYCSGTFSRAYCSVNGTASKDPNASAARSSAAIPRAYRATQCPTDGSATKATTTNPMKVATAPSSNDFGCPLRIPGSAITTAVPSASNDPSFRVECATSTVNTIHGISARKIPFPPELRSAFSLLVDDIEFSFRLT